MRGPVRGDSQQDADYGLRLYSESKGVLLKGHNQMNFRKIPLTSV